MENPMPSNDDRKITMDEIKALLEKPPLIRGESEEAFWNWFSAFADEHQPESFSDWLEVHDYAVKQWEQNRLQRSNSALVEGVQYRALRNLVMPFFTRLNSVSLDYGSQISHDFFFGNDKKKEQARYNLGSLGITDDQILAEAMQIRAKELVVFDRMDNYRANAKRNLRKGFDRRADTRRNQSDQPDSEQ
jgi:hypothetical protein